MLKQNKGKLILSSVCILLPILAGLLLWNRLPDTIPTHWNAAGEADNWSSKGFAVFGLPALLLVLHWVCLLVMDSDRSNANQSAKIMGMSLWICPVISLLGGGAIYSSAMGMEPNMGALPFALLGILFVIIGNYMPKCRHNYTIGIKLPWTFASEENWNATHRFAGKVWVAGGLLAMLGAFLPDPWKIWVLLVFLVVMVALPTAYSWLYDRKHR